MFSMLTLGCAVCTKVQSVCCNFLHCAVQFNANFSLEAVVQCSSVCEVVRLPPSWWGEDTSNEYLQLQFNRILPLEYRRALHSPHPLNSTLYFATKGSNLQVRKFQIEVQNIVLSPKIVFDRYILDPLLNMVHFKVILRLLELFLALKIKRCFASSAPPPLPQTHAHKEVRQPFQNVHIVHIHATLPFGNSATLPHWQMATLPHCHIATRCPWRLLPLPLPHSLLPPDDWCRNPAQHIHSYAMLAHAALNILNIYCATGVNQE